ncbi:MAG: zinc ABC transporter permease [Microscillaceae bacterium]|nr:zinc ABC transporter permease [Microscillaceae bacterium]
MRLFWDFFSFQDPNVRWVSLGITLMCASTAVVGVFAFLRKKALSGDAVSHAVLPGICLAFLLTETKAAWALLPGAVLTGLLSLWCIDRLTQDSRLKPDTAIALVLSVFYGAGILLLTLIQNNGPEGQSGLDKFLFGKAAALLPEDMWVFAAFCGLILLLIIAHYETFRLLSFHPAYAQSRGFAVRRLEALLSLLTVGVIAIGIQAVGVVLMAALLITPAAAARYWSHRLSAILWIAAGIGALGGLMGTFVSYTYPRMPTGPWVVATLSFLAFGSVLLGPKKGAWVRYRQARRNHQKMEEENLLKCLYQMGEAAQDWQKAWPREEIAHRRFFKPRALRRSIRQLRQKKYLLVQPQGLALSPEGIMAGRRITRIHRLWELYLTQHLQLAQDHVHEDAEAIEHIITPELEKALEARLNYPDLDPHQSPIPYDPPQTQ